MEGPIPVFTVSEEVAARIVAVAMATLLFVLGFGLGYLAAVAP